MTRQDDGSEWVQPLVAWGLFEDSRTGERFVSGLEGPEYIDRVDDASLYFVGYEKDQPPGERRATS